MKIVYILPSLEYNGGGAERIITEKANYLANDWGYEVCIINLLQEDNSSNFYYVSNKVRQINLGIPYHTQYHYKYPKRLWIKLKINHLMRKVLYETINTISPDILVGVSYFYADLVCSIPCNAKTIIECHEPRALKASSVYSGSFLSKLYTKFIYFPTIEKKADCVVSLTNLDKIEWRKAKRVEVIPNFSSMQITRQSSCDAKRVIAVGRLREEKGFDRLIDIWKIVSQKHPDWQLDIYGEGYLMTKLSKQIITNHVNKITLCGSTNNISKEYATSSICVVTSYLEGFSLVLLEAMRHGLPCIAFDCPFGPSTLIKDNLNGFLINNDNISLFVEKLCILMDNKNLRDLFSQESLRQAKLYNTETIMKRWKNLFENI